MVQRNRQDLSPALSIPNKSFLIWSTVGFFLLNCCNFLLRPLRDETGIVIGMQYLPWLFSGTFLALLFFTLAFAFYQRWVALPSLLQGIYWSFALMLLGYWIFYKLLSMLPQVRWAFFVGVSVFNLFSISLYWSLLMEILDKATATRFIGQIAASGSFGAIAGSVLAGIVSGCMGTPALLMAAALGLLPFLFYQNKLLRLLPAKNSTTSTVFFNLVHWLEPIRCTWRSPFFGTMAVSNFIYAIMTTFLYYEQLSLVETTASFAFPKATLLAIIAATVNIATLSIQLFFFQKWVVKMNSQFVFILVPLLTIATFLWLAWQPSIWLLVLSTTIHRAGNYSIIKPLREVLYTTVESDSKFGTKNFVDTIFARGGDLTGSWWYSNLLQASHREILLILSVTALGAIWIANSRKMAKIQESH